MNTRATRAALCLMACMACPALADADETYPRFYPGASVGGHLVLSDWSFGELDRISEPVDAESSLISALRIGVDLSPAWAIEISAAHLPFDASAETNDGLDFAARVRWTFIEGGAAPFLMLGAGTYVNPQPDPDSAPTEIQPQVHYGIGLGPQLGDHVRLRLDVRHMLTAFGEDSLANNIVAMIGLDLFFGGGDEPEPEPEPVQEAPSDRDGDGIVDASDACPDEPEDKDGIQDDDGCPEDDADSDGIADADDGCPTDAEDKDGIADSDGCPETDADSDGIADPDDRCPTEAETVNGFEDDDGCPDTAPAPAPAPAPKEPPAPPAPRVDVTCEAIEFDELVFFDLAQYTLRAEARPLLDEVARTMKARPDVRRVRVVGFADATGPTAFNDRLSRQRAWTVRQALIARGVAAKRLSVVARGESAPRASNDTEAGRAQNRRVEFTIVERDADARCP